METETVVMQLQGKELQELLATIRSWPEVSKDPSTRVKQEHNPSNTLISDSWPLEL
jgi:hypothetical protein